MNKPLHTRPFNLEHARAGAPFSGQYGESVRILIWDRKHPTHPILAIEEHGEQEAIAFRADGIATHDNVTLSSRLVMTPLGFIEGKPVFVGDELVTPTGMKWVATPTCHDGHRSLADCTWPAPAKVYPETRMDAVKLVEVHDRVLNQSGAAGGRHGAVIAVANAALRHAVVGGYLVLPAIHDALQHEIKMLKRDRAGIETTTNGADHTTAIEYPETTMHDTELLLAADGSGKRLLAAQLRHVANSALKHAIDSRLVALPGKEMDDADIFKALRRVQEKHGAVLINDLVVRDTVKALLVTEPKIDQLKADPARESRELGKAERALELAGYRRIDGEWRQVGGTHFCGSVNSFHVTGNESSIDVVKDLFSRSAARDMAIAEAVRDAAYVAAMNSSQGHEGRVVRQLDLPTIIAGVKS